MNTHTEINDRPVIQLFIHNNNCYVYDYNKNIILRLSRSHYAEINELYTIGIKFYRELNKGTAEYKDIIILLNSGYFVDRTVEQLIHPYDGILEILLNRFTNDLVLQVTQDCNFQCRYCLYANDTKVERNHSKSMMDFSTAKKSIDYLYNHSMDANEVTIGYYGGEPFLNFDLIKRATEYANSIFQSKRIRYLITTNCSIINDEIIDFIITNNIQLTISYDGPYQDDHRKFRNNGSDTSNIVQQNIKKIMKKDCRYFEENVSFSPVIFSDESYDDTSNYFKQFAQSVDNVSFGYANLSGVDYIYSNTKLEVRGSQKQATRPDIYDDMVSIIEDKSPIPKHWSPSGQCVIGIKRMFVNVSGDIYPCEKIVENEAFCFGSVNDTFVNINKARRLLNISNLSETDCKKCWAFRFCSACISHYIDVENNCLTSDNTQHYCNKLKDNILKSMKYYISELDNSL